MKKEEMNCFNSSAEEEVLGKCNSRLQHKVWKPSKLRLDMKCDVEVKAVESCSTRFGNQVNRHWMHMT